MPPALLPSSPAHAITSQNQPQHLPDPPNTELAVENFRQHVDIAPFSNSQDDDIRIFFKALEIMILGIRQTPTLSSSDNFALVVALRSYLAGEAKSVWASQPEFIRQNYPKSKEILIETFSNASAIEAKLQAVRRQLKELRQGDHAMIEHVARAHVLLMQLPLTERDSAEVTACFIDSCKDEELAKRLRQWRHVNQDLPAWDVLHAAVLMEKFDLRTLPPSFQRPIKPTASEDNDRMMLSEDAGSSSSQPFAYGTNSMIQVDKCEKSPPKKARTTRSSIFEAAKGFFGSSPSRYQLRNRTNGSSGVAGTTPKRTHSDDSSRTSNTSDDDDSEYDPTKMEEDSPFRVPRAPGSPAKHRSPRKQSQYDRSKSLICKLCSRHFRYQAHLETHFECVHKAQNRQTEFGCKGCNVKFPAKEDLDEHIRLTHQNFWYHQHQPSAFLAPSDSHNSPAFPMFRANLPFRSTTPLPKQTTGAQAEPWTPSPGLIQMQDPENAMIDPILLQSSARDNVNASRANVMRYQEERYGKQDVFEALLGQENGGGDGAGEN